MSIIRLDQAERIEAEQLYRAIADGETTEDLLQRFYDFVGEAAGLRPPYPNSISRAFAAPVRSRSMADVWLRAHHADFRKALAMIMGAVDFNSTIPILGHVLFSIEGDVLTLRASNLDLQVDAECEIFESVERAVFCLPGDRLKALSSSLPESGEIVFGSGRFKDQVSIRSGKASLSIPFLPGEDFPSIGNGSGADWYDVDATTAPISLASACMLARSVTVRF
jgi:DNA polymerase III beta subunit, N-terminal domain